MTEAPDKMWVFPKADWFNAGASNVRLSSAGANDVEYTRSDIAEAEVSRLKAALERIERYNGVAHNYISCYDCGESSMIARAVLAHKD